MPCSTCNELALSLMLLPLKSHVFEINRLLSFLWASIYFFNCFSISSKISVWASWRCCSAAHRCVRCSCSRARSYTESSYFFFLTQTFLFWGQSCSLLCPVFWTPWLDGFVCLPFLAVLFLPETRSLLQGPSAFLTRKCTVKVLLNTGFVQNFQEIHLSPHASNKAVPNRCKVLLG